MNIDKLTVEFDFGELSVNFSVCINNIPLTGNIKNCIHTVVANNKYLWILRLEFDNKRIIKHPKYKEIRDQLICTIARKTLAQNALHGRRFLAGTKYEYMERDEKNSQTI